MLSVVSCSQKEISSAIPENTKDRVNDTLLLSWIDQYLFRSPRLVKRVIKNKNCTTPLLQMKAVHNRDTIARLWAVEEVIPNVNTNTLLGVKKQRETGYEAMMSRETAVSKSETFAILFQDMKDIRRCKLRYGNARGHEWSQLIIWFNRYIQQVNGPSSGVSPHGMLWRNFCISRPTERSYNTLTPTLLLQMGCF